MNEYCSGTPTIFGVFDPSYAPTLIFYAYIPIFIVSIFFGIFILYRDRFSTRAKSFFLLNTFFGFWILVNIMQWITVPATLNMFAWEVLALFETGIFLLTILFFESFFREGKAPNVKISFLLFILALPVITLMPSEHNVSYFDVGLCEGFSGSLWTYIYAVEAFTIIWLLVSGLYKSIIYTDKSKKIQSFILGIGLASMLGVFFGTNFYAETTQLYEVNLFGPLGLIFGLISITYLISKYRAFNVRIFTAQIFVVLLIILLFGLNFVAKSDITRIVVAVTTIFSAIFGYILIRSVRKEIEQREQIQKLAAALEENNKRLEKLNLEKTEFISLATHQIRAPLSAIKGYASLILEGDYGKTSEDIKDAVSTMYTSAHNLVGVVGDYLDISRLDLNRMKFNVVEFNLVDTISEIAKEQQPNLRGHDLELHWNPETAPQPATISADVGKIKQVISNLIDNAIKYTPKGSITLAIGKAQKLGSSGGFRITVSDTGVGINPETMPKLFKRFSRADGAHEINIHGTGLGLYLARKMIESHGGKIWAESEGEGKGSRFIIELPQKAVLKEGNLAEGEGGE